jgi:hypothetical protein
MQISFYFLIKTVVDSAQTESLTTNSSFPGLFSIPGIISTACFSKGNQFSEQFVTQISFEISSFLPFANKDLALQPFAFGVSLLTRLFFFFLKQFWSLKQNPGCRFPAKNQRKWTCKFHCGSSLKEGSKGMA